MTKITEKMYPLQVRVPGDLVKRIRIEAAIRGVHPRDVVVDVLDKQLPKFEPQKRKAS